MVFELRMVGDTGVEPVTSCMSSKRSNQTELIALNPLRHWENGNYEQAVAVSRFKGSHMIVPAIQLTLLLHVK